MTTQELVDKLTNITNQNIENVEGKIIGLTDEQLNWRPNETTWSVNDILAHLNAYASYYHAAFLKKIDSTRFTNTKEKFISSPLGRSAWKSMKLGNLKNIKRKFKAPKGYNPLVDREIAEGDQRPSFKASQEELLRIIGKSSQVNMRRVKIPISISKAIRLRLGDALLFVIYHNERHVQQALNLINHRNFPK
jgi:uncharacterized damage-inducible protein DinB